MSTERESELGNLAQMTDRQEWSQMSTEATRERANLVTSNDWLLEWRMNEQTGQWILSQLKSKGWKKSLIGDGSRGTI